MGGSTYVIQWGDTLGNIAMRNGISLGDILAVNTQIWNPSLIFPGQVINLPAFASIPPSTYNSSNKFISIIESPHFSALKVTYGHGLLVRSGPAMTYSEIKSPFVSAVKDSKWAYRNKSVTVDSTGLVWVEVALSPLVDGYSTGWIMVKDQLGTYFTRPNIDP